MAIQYKTGDATYPQTEGPIIIAHISNNLGGWGSGFVLAISKRWHAPEELYRRTAESGPLVLGTIQMANVGEDWWVCNMVAQNGFWRLNQPKGIYVDYEALEVALKALAVEARAKGATVVMPRIGTGLGGGSWDKVEPLILSCLQDIQVEVYDLPL
jgi:O-acetyl-ADP-ribose deacetylase (regulator of RNase III)